METRNFGRLGTVSALTLGGGGIGGVWGRTDRTEAVATVHAALEAGITMLDLAPTYGPDHEAERVAGEALASTAAAPMITTKVELPDDEPGGLAQRMVDGLHGSLTRLGREHINLFLLHSQLRPAAGGATAKRTVGWDAYLEQVVPAFADLQERGLIREWGITGVGHPDAVVQALTGDPRPAAVQVVVNALDMSGDMWVFGEQEEPRNPVIMQAAVTAEVPVVAIRAVAAGALTDQPDRALPADSPAAADYARAEGFRRLAAELGESPAALAHRYALSVPGVSTVVLGVKNRAELSEVLDAEERGPLGERELAAIGALR